MSLLVFVAGPSLGAQPLRIASGWSPDDHRGAVHRTASLSPTSAALVASGLVLGSRGRARRQRTVARQPNRTTRQFFGNLFGPEEVIDPDDPGRVGVCKEYQSMPGTVVAAEESEFGWAVVSKHEASEQDGHWIGEAPGEVSQEWRELRLAKTSTRSRPGSAEGTGQSVVKVSLCEGAPPQQVPYCMALAYTKSLCAAALTGAHVQEALPLDAIPSQRALVIGLGAGSIPLWLEHTFPAEKMRVDALEIDPAVVKVATEEMGFPKEAVRPSKTAQEAGKDAVSNTEALRVYLVPGEDFVEALASQSDAYKYDMVFIDAFDKAGKVPPVLVDGEGTFLQSLSQVLAPKATVVLNLLVGMTGTGSCGGPQEIEAMVTSIQKTCCNASSEIFTIRTPISESSGNQLYGFLRAGRSDRSKPLKEALKESAEMVNADFPKDSLGQKIRFDLARRVVFSYQDWPKKN
ncbi:eEF1A lysine and N-terminal methyltransferase (eEF1A-KNMT) (Methyltransferase-like protein 13) [Includes: eEF1A lysine methyltransferase [Durusdinium trenchii]|uniref:EEF1A lysine and N-terminal methyltransferase (EEF1A-KNMT) (Methyltransferase-like protein 13) n=1 Tax=Durusdinium trenchii TaxID=1381693 RepID=A0ABP0HG05_9DINO